MRDLPNPVRVSLVGVPEAMVSSLSGIYDTLGCFDLLGTFDDAVPRGAPFAPEIVGLPGNASVSTASGLPLPIHRSIDEVTETDVVVLPSLFVEDGTWRPGRYPELVRWLTRMSAGGAMLCSACSGVLILAETGLLDGRDATIHWAYARTFRENFPSVRLRIESVLVASGDRQQFIMSGASSSWHDLVLYLVSRMVSPTAALAVSKFMLLQWHEDGQAPYVVFEPPLDHGDAAVLEVQLWIHEHFSVASPVEEMTRRSDMSERGFKRRFRRATGVTPLEYVQRLRVEDAKRRLERTEATIEDIGWTVGYEDPAFFRRLFKRTTGLTPSAYRKKFSAPAYPGIPPSSS